MSNTSRLCLVVFLAFLGMASYPEFGFAAENQRLVIGSGVRVRAKPEIGGSEVGKVSLGVVIQVIGKSADKATVGKQNDYWYQVKIGDGKEGWVFGALTRPFSLERKQEVWRELIKERLALEGAGINDWVEFLGFLGDVLGENPGKGPATDGTPLKGNFKAEFELAQLQAVSKLLETHPATGGFDKKPDFPVLKAFEADLVYSEPAGQWMLRAEKFWNLYEKYRLLPVADSIAFAASKAPIPGETEGYLPAVISLTRMTGGKYLEVKPKGEFVPDVLDQINEYILQFIPSGKTQPGPGTFEKGDVKSLKEDIKALIDLVKKTEHPRGEALIRNLGILSARIK